MLNEKNRMFLIYMARLAGRVIIFVLVCLVYLFRKDWLTDILTQKFFLQFSPLHILWAILMAGMVIHLLPKFRITMGGRKSRSYTYTEPEGGYDRLQLLEYVQKMNQRAWFVLLLWLMFNAIFGILYCLHILGPAEILMLSLLYFTCDIICMMLFCPFQKYIMGNRCCVNCRIFDWGHMMMYTPMIFIPSFFSWSLLFMALIIAVRWEIVYARHPERFWRGSNATIKCENCTDRMCRIKKPLVTGIDKVASAMPSPANKLSANADELEKDYDLSE